MIKQNDNSTSTLFTNTYKFTLSQVYNLSITSIIKHINAPRHDSYMHVVPIVTKVVTSWCNKNIIIVTNNWIQSIRRHQYEYKIRYHQSWMHKHMTQQQCICSQQIVTNNRLQYYTCNHHIQHQHLACISSTHQQPTTYISCYNSST